MIARKAQLAGNAVVVLGAGASRSEALAQDYLRSRVLPPLDNDFLRQLQSLEDPSPEAGALLEAARDLFGGSADIGLEQFFTMSEFCRRFEEERWASGLPGEPGAKYPRVLEEFQRVLLEVLTQAKVVGGVDDRNGVDPVLHRALVGTLEAGDALISFNYDTLIDRALAEAAGDLWDASCGYGVAAEGEVGYWSGSPGLCPPARSLRLLKMHGSVHWDMFGQRLRLTRPPYHAHYPSIIPPAWHKLIMERPLFADVWNLAYLRLSVCDSLVVVGYSLPPTDMWTQALFRSVAAGRRFRPLEHIIVANPDDAALARILEAWHHAIGPKTRVIRFSDFARAIDFLTDLPALARAPLGSGLPGAAPYDAAPVPRSTSHTARWVQPLPLA